MFIFNFFCPIAFPSDFNFTLYSLSYLFFVSFGSTISFILTTLFSFSVYSLIHGDFHVLIRAIQMISSGIPSFLFFRRTTLSKLCINFLDKIIFRQNVNPSRANYWLPCQSFFVLLHSNTLHINENSNFLHYAVPSFHCESVASSENL